MKAADLKKLCKTMKIRIKGSETKAVLKKLLLDSVQGQSSPVVVDIPIGTSSSVEPSAAATPVSMASSRSKAPQVHSTYNTRRSSLTPVASIRSEPASAAKKSLAKKSARNDDKQDERGSAKRQKSVKAASPVAATPAASTLSPIASMSTRLSAGKKSSKETSSPQRSTTKSSPVASLKRTTPSLSPVSERKSKSSQASRPSPAAPSAQKSQSQERPQSAAPVFSQSTSSQPVFTMSSDPSQSAMNTEDSDSEDYESVQSDSLAPAGHTASNFSKAEEMHMADDIIELLDSDDDVPASKPSEGANKMDDGASQVSSLHETVGSVQPVSEASLAVQAFSKLGSKLLSASAVAENESTRSASNLSLSEREYELLKLMLEKVKPPTAAADSKPASSSSVAESQKVASPVVSRLSFHLPPPPPPSASFHFTMDSAVKSANPRLSFEGASWASRESFMPTLTDITPVKPIASTLFGGDNRLAERLPTPYHRATASELKKRALDDMDDTGGVESSPFHKKELITTSQGVNVSRGRFSFSSNSKFMPQPTAAMAPSFSLGAHEGNNLEGMSYIQRRRLQKQSTPSAPPASETAKRILEALSELKAPARKEEVRMVADAPSKPMPEITIKPVSSIPIPAPPRVSFLVANSSEVERPRPEVTFGPNKTSPGFQIPARNNQSNEQTPSAKATSESHSGGKNVRFNEQPAVVQDGEFSFEEPVAIEDLDDVSDDVTQTNNFIKYTFSPGTKKRRQEVESNQQSGAVAKKGSVEPKEPKAAKAQDSAPSTGINIWAARSINDGIKCDMCLVRNKNDATRCVSCENPLKGKATTASGQSAEVPNIWAKAASSDTVKCQACLVPNKKGASKCVACETALGNSSNNGAASGTSDSKKPEISWSSTAPKTDSNAAIGSQGFTFGSAPPAPSSGADNKPSGFSFGVPPAASPAAETSKPGGFSFGAPSAGSSASSGAPAFSFGAPPAASSQPSAPASSAPSFTFGVSSATNSTVNNDDDGALRRKKRRDFDEEEDGGAKEKKQTDLPATSFNPSSSFSSSSLPVFSAKPADKPENAVVANSADGKPAFSFSLPASNGASEAAKVNSAPSFTFGAASSAGSSQPPAPPAAAAAAATASTFSLPSFSFGAGGAEGAKPVETKSQEKASVSFQAPHAAPPSSAPSAPFTFGAPANKVVSFGAADEPSATFKPAVPSVPVPNTTTHPPFTFGGSSASSSFPAPAPSVPAVELKAFTFGATAAPAAPAADPVKPSVSFGGADKPSAAPAPFVFGAANSTPAALPAAPFTAASSAKVDSAPKPFSFGAPTATPLFGATPATSSQPANTGFSLGSSAKPADIMSPGGMDMGPNTAAAPVINSAPFGAFVAAPSSQMFAGNSSATAAPSTGPFGALASAAPANPFGSAAASNPFAATASAPLFGQPAPAPQGQGASGGLFGAPAAPAAFGGFAANPTPVVNPFGGAPASTPLFGAAPVAAPAPSPAFNSAPFAFGAVAPSAPVANAFGGLSSNNSSNSLNSSFPAIPGSAFAGASAGGGFNLGTADKGEQRRKVKAKRPGT